MAKTKPWVTKILPNLEQWLRRNDSKEKRSDDFLGSVEVQKLKAFVKKTFDAHCEVGLYTLKLHFLDHVVDDLERFGSMKLLNSSSFEIVNVHIKLAYRSTSQRQSSRLQETVRVCEHYQTVDKRRPSCFEKREAEIYGEKQD